MSKTSHFKLHSTLVTKFLILSLVLYVSQFKKTIKLVDPNFNVPSLIEMLLGADIFWQILGRDRIELGNLLPILQKTKLGWIISGPIPHICKTVYCNFVTAYNNHNVENDIQDQFNKLWITEECSFDPLRSKEQIKCETHFVIMTSRDMSGRFVVSILLKDSVDKLGTSTRDRELKFFGNKIKKQRGT